MGRRVIIRAGKPDDADAIFEVASGPKAQSGTLQMPYPSIVTWRERLSTTPEGFHRLVAEIDGRVIGMAGLHVEDAPRRRHVGEIGMMVHDDFQGQGAGRALLEALLDLADNWLNLHRVELQVYTDNAPGIHLYETHGFVIEGTLRDFAFRDGEYVDAYYMARVRDALSTPPKQTS
jgi:L-phenylalanine/L-methionine N-acetyltransferase